MDYSLLKSVHITAVVVTGVGFAVRGGAILTGAGWVHGRIAKTLPHVVDSLLLATALAMVATSGLNPFATPWILAKLVGLLAYIGLGMVVMRPRFGRTKRTLCGLLALTVLVWMASVAVLKNPSGFIALMVPM